MFGPFDPDPPSERAILFLEMAQIVPVDCAVVSQADYVGTAIGCKFLDVVAIALHHDAKAAFVGPVHEPGKSVPDQGGFTSGDREMMPATKFELVEKMNSGFSVERHPLVVSVCSYGTIRTRQGALQGGEDGGYAVGWFTVHVSLR